MFVVDESAPTVRVTGGNSVAPASNAAVVGGVELFTFFHHPLDAAPMPSLY
jgi:hypothetical protein